MVSIVVDLAVDQVFSVSQPKEKHRHPPFLAIGSAGNKFSKVKGMDLTELLMDLSAPSHWLFWRLVRQVNPKTNQAEFSTKDIPEADKVKASRGYKELNSIGLVLRIGPGKYMLHPKAVLPEFGRYEEVQSMWDSLQKN